MLLIDTNVVSELRKVRAGRTTQKFARWARSVERTEMFISAITVAELRIGVLLAERRDAKQGAILREWLRGYALPAFESRIISIDSAIALRSAELHVPDPQPINDALIAATALVHGLTVVSRNERDFARSNVPLINPWN